MDSIIGCKLRKSKSLWTLNTLVYAGAVVAEKRVKNGLPKPQAKVEQRLGKIEHLRRVVGWLESELDRKRRGIRLTPRQWRNRKQLTNFQRPQVNDETVCDTGAQKSLWKLKATSSEESKPGYEGKGSTINTKCWGRLGGRSEGNTANK